MRHAPPLSLVILSALLGAAASAQERMVPRFDLGVYGGGTFATSWFSTPESTGDVGWGPGASPVFGANTTFWASPSFGVRFNGAYVPSSLPETAGVQHPDAYGMTSWLYDLDLVFRPWFHRSEDFIGTTTLFLGAGAITSSATGLSSEGCVGYAPWTASGVCVSTGGTTRARGVVGVEVDVTSLGRVTLYGQGALHGFPAPVRICDVAPCADAGVSPGGARASFVVMPHLALGVRAGLGER